ncbi:reverse transcriptase [Phytophthora megakarya]|uniref:Reverse transcriptase n=1 Tax=Phytophthora megakarya TaxID=4795 RepID=A0A225UDC3_9STRA|nr:reverse transcriptase [Phytophthora megakarya]
MWLTPTQNACSGDLEPRPALHGSDVQALPGMLERRQRATLDYHPQAKSQQERAVQTVIHSAKAYVQTVDQSDWDELAKTACGR